MKSADSSAPCNPIPYVDFSWRPLRARAKTIPLGDTATNNHEPKSGNISAVGGIGAKSGCEFTSERGAHFVQEHQFDAIEKKLLAFLSGDEVVPAAKLARLAKLSEFSARLRLEKLAAKRMVEGTVRGYRRVK